MSTPAPRAIEPGISRNLVAELEALLKQVQAEIQISTERLQAIEAERALLSARLIVLRQQAQAIAEILRAFPPTTGRDVPGGRR